ncbi:MAG: ribonuclease P protein component [Phycisphaerae bacterium]|nr:ribonuclease P protein component [Phycisphaerae bacterium]
MGKYSFTKKMRICKNDQFLHCMKNGVRASDGLMILYSVRNGLGCSRFGVSVGKKAGIAVVRNRLKRVFRHAFALNQHDIRQNMDYVAIVKNSWYGAVGEEKASYRAARRLKLKDVEISFLALLGTIADRIK